MKGNVYKRGAGKDQKCDSLLRLYRCPGVVLPVTQICQFVNGPCSHSFCEPRIPPNGSRQVVSFPARKLDESLLRWHMMFTLAWALGRPCCYCPLKVSLSDVFSCISHANFYNSSSASRWKGHEFIPQWEWLFNPLYLKHSVAIFSCAAVFILSDRKTSWKST